MYAIVDIAGQQFKVEKNNKIFVHRLENEEGSEVSFDKVLLIDNEGKVVVGTPVVEGAAIVAKVVSHLKGDKVLVFKKKRRKGYQKLNGHRQSFTEIIVEDILEKGYKAKSAAPKAEVKETAAEEVKEEKTAEKKATTKKASAEDAPAKKTAAKTETAAKKAAPKKAAAPKKEANKDETEA